MVIVTLSSLKIKNMSVFLEIRHYFSQLIKSLAKNAGLTDLFERTRRELEETFEIKFEEQNNQIIELKIQVLVQENITNKLLMKCDDNKEYSQRSCLLVYGTESDKESVLEKVKKRYNALTLSFFKEEIDRVTGSVRNMKIKILKKNVKSIFIKFIYQNYFVHFYNA